MPINSFKDDEQTVHEAGKVKTLLRLFSYLFAYKKQVLFVLFIMMICVGITLLNPLIIEAAIDDYIGQGDWNGLVKLIAFAIGINIVMVLLIIETSLQTMVLLTSFINTFTKRRKQKCCQTN